MRVFLITILLLLASFLHGKELTEDLEQLFALTISENCPEVSDWSAKEFTISPKKIVDLDVKGKQLCYSGEKKIFAKLENGKVKVVKFKLKLYRSVYTFKRALERGEEITLEDVEISKIEVKRRTLRDVVPKVIGYETKVKVKKGTPVYFYLVKKRRLIKRGDKVVVSFIRNGIRISMDGVARNHGGIDDTISVKNTLSNRVLKGVVTGRGHVSVGGDR